MKKKDSRPGNRARAGNEKKQAHAAKPARRADPAPKKREPDAVRGVQKAAPKEKTVVAAAIEQVPARALMQRTGALPAEQVPVILESSGAGDFHLIDSGNGLKLEQYGDYRIVRPEAQALWRPSIPDR
ncbi:MAG TPA: SAM-dependent methyltransferase, partial [Agrobacterium sp.]|nr:SAM-dependent methyltransferase [Agrobacterium sp.]